VAAAQPARRYTTPGRVESSTSRTRAAIWQVESGRTSQLGVNSFGLVTSRALLASPGCTGGAHL
jgi:hypothetical protein